MKKGEEIMCVHINVLFVPNDKSVSNLHLLLVHDRNVTLLRHFPLLSYPVAPQFFITIIHNSFPHHVFKLLIAIFFIGLSEIMICLLKSTA